MPLVFLVIIILENLHSTLRWVPWIGIWYWQFWGCGFHSHIDHSLKSWTWWSLCEESPCPTYVSLPTQGILWLCNNSCKGFCYHWIYKSSLCPKLYRSAQPFLLPLAPKSAKIFTCHSKWLFKDKEVHWRLHLLLIIGIICSLLLIY